MTQITVRQTLLDDVLGDLGHIYNLLDRCFQKSDSCSAVCGTGMSRTWIMGTTSASCSTVCCWTRACGPRGSPRQGGREPPGTLSPGWGGGASVAVARRACPRAPPRPCPSSVLLRSAACTPARPSRRCAARVEATSAVPSDDGPHPHRRRVHPSWRPLETKASVDAGVRPFDLSCSGGGGWVVVVCSCRYVLSV